LCLHLIHLLPTFLSVFTPWCQYSVWVCIEWMPYHCCCIMYIMLFCWAELKCVWVCVCGCLNGWVCIDAYIGLCLFVGYFVFLLFLFWQGWCNHGDTMQQCCYKSCYLLSLLLHNIFIPIILLLPWCPFESFIIRRRI